MYELMDINARKENAITYLIEKQYQKIYCGRRNQTYKDNEIIAQVF
jgi:hypothetical protein